MSLITLHSGALRATVSPGLGASLVDFSMEGPLGFPYPLVRRTPAGASASALTSSFIMAPWTNRIAGASFEFRGERHRLRTNFADGTAIHGDVSDRGWRITDRTPVSVRMAFDSGDAEDVNFPFAFGAVARYELAPGELRMDLSVVNTGTRSMPAGCGVHPYFPRRLWSEADEVEVRAEVSGRYPSARQLPTGPSADDGASAALRRGGALGSPGLDDVFSGFEGSAEVVWPSSGVRLGLECSAAYEHLVVFTPRSGDSADAPPLPWFCVEPVTMCNDGFNLLERGWDGTGVRVLEPGESLDTTVRMAVSRV